MVVICSIHEISHCLFFLVNGISVKSIRIGLFKICFENKGIKILFSNDSIFSGYCIAAKPERPMKLQIIIALISGGLSGIILALIILPFISSVEGNLKIFMLCLVVVGFVNGTGALFSPLSTDHILIKKYLNN